MFVTGFRLSSRGVDVVQGTTPSPSVTSGNTAEDTDGNTDNPPGELRQL
jgi:hypothetical protein